MSVGSITGGKIVLHVQRSTAGNDQKVDGNLQAGTRFGGMVASFPGRILADSVDGHFAPDVVAPGNLHRQAGERRQRIVGSAV
jgi:hypothetical protein